MLHFLLVDTCTHKHDDMFPEAVRVAHTLNCNVAEGLMVTCHQHATIKVAVCFCTGSLGFTLRSEDGSSVCKCSLDQAGCATYFVESAQPEMDLAYIIYRLVCMHL